MKTSRWLLPFTCAVDMRAIEALVHLAAEGGITLVAVSLIKAPRQTVGVPATPCTRGARLEDIQQSKDFLEAVLHKATRLSVPVEQHEVFTVDAVNTITLLTSELHCDAIVLVNRGKREALLHAYLLKRLLEEPPAPLLLLRMLTRAEGGQHLGARLLAWLRRSGSKQPAVSVGQSIARLSESFQMQVEESTRG